MWKDLFSFIKAATASYKRLTQADENIKKLQAHADKHDEEVDDVKKALVQSLFEFEKFRMQIEGSKEIAAEQRRTIEAQRQSTERDYENLVLRLELALKSNVLALPPGFNASNSTETEARFAALERQIEELRGRVKTLENPV